MALVFRIESRAHRPPEIATLAVKCERGAGGWCRRSLWRNPPSGIMWQWDGDFERPTIKPSIACQGGCGRHFTITAGVVQGAEG